MNYANLGKQVLYGINRQLAIKSPEKVTVVQECRGKYKLIQELQSYLNWVKKIESVLMMYCKKIVNVLPEATTWIDRLEMSEIYTKWE